MRELIYNKSWSKHCKLAFFCGEKAKTKNEYAFCCLNRKKLILENVRQIARNKQLSILDLGAAGGDITLEMAEMGHNVTWNDIEPTLEEYVRAKYERGKINYKPGNIFDLKLKKKYDLVIATEVLEHVAYPEQLLAKIKSFLSPGGYIIISTPNGGYLFEKNLKFSLLKDQKKLVEKQFGPDSSDHLFALEYSDLKQMSQKLNLKELKIIFFNNILTCGNLKLRYLYWFMPKIFIDYLEEKTQKLSAKISKKFNSHILMVFKTKKVST